MLPVYDAYNLYTYCIPLDYEYNTKPRMLQEPATE